MYFQQPKGRHVVSVCHNLSCHLLGAKGIVEHLERKLGVEVGETTADGRRHAPHRGVPLRLRGRAR